MRQIVLYAAIGAIVFVIDVGSFRALLSVHVFLAAAVTLSFCIGLAAHFTLNRFWNFRNFDRKVHSQLRTYFVIVFVQYVVQIVTIELGVTYFGLSPLAAKFVSIAFNFPIGFLGHRYLTFGPGITNAVRSWRGLR